MTEEIRLQLQYIPLEQAALWDDNPKRHDTEGIIRAIAEYGFKDPPKYEPALNGGSGGIAVGNGRLICLRIMRDSGQPVPRGVAALDDGYWAVPILFGVDAQSERAAVAYAIDHNNLTAAGGGFDGFEVARMWDDSYVSLLEGVGATITVDDSLLAALSAADEFLASEPQERTLDPATSEVGDVTFRMGDLKEEIPFDLYVRFAERVMMEGSVAAAIESWLEPIAA